MMPISNTTAFGFKLIAHGGYEPIAIGEQLAIVVKP